MEWISIKERLPEGDVSALIASDGRVTIADWFASEQRWDLSREDKAIGIFSNTITHWMPLPESPKERHNDWDRELLLCDGVTVISRIPGTPVEYTGKAFDREYYFKARGKWWRLAIAETVDKAIEATGADEPLEFADFFCAGCYGDDGFAAGYMPLKQAEEIIRRGVKLWRRAQEEHKQ